MRYWRRPSRAHSESLKLLQQLGAYVHSSWRLPQRWQGVWPLHLILRLEESQRSGGGLRAASDSTSCTRCRQWRCSDSAWPAGRVARLSRRDSSACCPRAHRGCCLRGSGSRSGRRWCSCWPWLSVGTGSRLQARDVAVVRAERWAWACASVEVACGCCVKRRSRRGESGDAPPSIRPLPSHLNSASEAILVSSPGLNYRLHFFTHVYNQLPSFLHRRVPSSLPASFSQPSTHADTFPLHPLANGTCRDSLSIRKRTIHTCFISHPSCASIEIFHLTICRLRMWKPASGKIRWTHPSLTTPASGY